MMKKIKKEDFLDYLKNWGKIVEIEEGIDVKDLFLPKEEIYLVFHKKKDSVEQDEFRNIERKVVFNIPPCYAKSIELLDFNFLREPLDSFYKERRDSILVVVKACRNPHNFCFCTSLGNSPFDRKGDIFIFEKDGYYFAEPLTDRAKEVLAWDKYEDVSQDEFKEVELEKQKVEKEIEKFDIVNLDKKLYSVFNDKIWKELSFRCVNCGACTFHCPVCYCFDIQDVDRTNWGYRERVWDSCMFSIYSYETSGHNPRAERHARMRNRIMHKFAYYPVSYKEYQCVGCGKCVEVCPTGFDIREALLRLKEVVNE